MKLGILVFSDDSETIWNGLRFGNYALSMGDKVNIFFMGKGVEFESLDTEQFNLKEQWQALLNGGGYIFACGTCLEIHGLKASEIYKVSTMNDLYEIINTSDKVITL